MRKILALLVVAILFVAGVMPVLADDGSCASAEKSKSCGFVLPFQRIADTMTVGKAKPKNQLRPILQKVDTFQNASEAITKTADKTRKVFSCDPAVK